MQSVRDRRFLLTKQHAVSGKAEDHSTSVAADRALATVCPSLEALMERYSVARETPMDLQISAIEWV
jgi:hypothetical protein